MKDYIYDGSFEGLLCCIYAHYYIDYASSITSDESMQCSLFSDCYKVETDEEKARIVQEAIEEKLTNFNLRRIYRVFLSCEKEKEMLILRYVVGGFKFGKKFTFDYGQQVTFEMNKLDKRVGFECHRLNGLVRFEELKKGVMYSAITPDNDIVELLAHHFVDRFRTNPFIIHDTERGKAVVANKGQWIVTKMTLEEVSKMKNEISDYSKLWKMYHEHIAMLQRKNTRCQKNFMPVRYWKNLVEMKPETLETGKQ